MEECDKSLLTNSLKEIISFILLCDIYFRSKQQISRRQIILRNRNDMLVYCKELDKVLGNIIPRVQNIRDPASIN